jgi:hypothetical protein
MSVINEDFRPGVASPISLDSPQSSHMEEVLTCYKKFDKIAQTRLKEAEESEDPLNEGGPF